MYILIYKREKDNHIVREFYEDWDKALWMFNAFTKDNEYEYDVIELVEVAETKSILKFVDND